MPGKRRRRRNASVPAVPPPAPAALRPPQVGKGRSAAVRRRASEGAAGMTAATAVAVEVLDATAAGRAAPKPVGLAAAKGWKGKAARKAEEGGGRERRYCWWPVNRRHPRRRRRRRERRYCWWPVTRRHPRRRRRQERTRLLSRLLWRKCWAALSRSFVEVSKVSSTMQGHARSSTCRSRSSVATQRGAGRLQQNAAEE